jgi:tetratricopeptide (TPR) repeat protein
LSGRSQSTSDEAPLCERPLNEAVPKITDFGVAKLLSGGGADPTQSGAVMGTPSYMAPEQAGGKTREAGPATDVYALGAILYELLTGRPPFLAETPLETLLLVQTAEPVPPTRLQPGCPRDLETICMKCLEKWPWQRYDSALALADDLRRFRNEEPIVARPAGVLYRFGKFARRNKVLVGGTVAVFLALVLGIIGTSTGLVLARAGQDRALRAEHDATVDRDRAQDATREARRLLAVSYQQTAELAMRRGAWRTALENIDKALDAGKELEPDHADPVALHLDKVKAWAALDEGPKALTEIKQLVQRADLGDLEGSVLLWQADLALCFSSDDDKALGMVRQAAQKQLSPAEAAYAAGLLAGTSPDALRFFQAALEKDPFHHRANGMLIQLLTFLGRFAEARARLAFAEQVFPDDPTFKVLHAQIEALEHNLPAAHALIDETPQLQNPQRQTARALVELLAELRGMEGVAGADPGADLLPALSKVLAKAVLMAQGQRDPAADDPTRATSGLLLPIPPVLFKAFRPIPPLMWMLPLRNYAGVSRVLAEVVHIHPDGLGYLALGAFLAAQDRLVEAEQAFLTAAANPSLIPVRRAALMGAVNCEWLLAVGVQLAPEARKRNQVFGGCGQLGAVLALAPAGPVPVLPALYLKPEPPSARALRSVRQMVALGGIRPDQASRLAHVAIETGQYDLARWIVADWERQAPDDLEALRKRARVELKAGAYGRAIEAAERLRMQADKVLSTRPKDQQAQACHRDAETYRAQAVEQVGKQAKALGP